MAWAIGQSLQAGKYMIEAVLGVGGFGITYLAHDREGSQVVIKTLNDTAQADPRFTRLQEDFVNEALWLAKCTHPHIVQVHRFFQEENLWCMVMEYIAGQDLANRIRQWGILSEAEALRYIWQVGEALTLMHQNGLLHRDVKPENIMIRAERPEAVLLDLGIAREFKPNSTKTHTAFLSGGYAPIEQYEYQTRRGAYTDVYALAATLYYVLTGQIPKESQIRAYNILRYHSDPLEPPQQLNPQVSDRTHQAILQGMAVEFKDRPQSIQEWLALLPENDPAAFPVSTAAHQAYYSPQPFASESPVPASPEPPPTAPNATAFTLPISPPASPDRPPPPEPAVPKRSWVPTKSRIWLIGGIVAASMVAGSAFALWWTYRRAETRLATAATLSEEGRYEECIAIASDIPNTIQSTYEQAQSALNRCAAGLLDRAQQQADNAEYQTAIQEVAKIPPESTVYADAQTQVEQWSDALLQQATQLYETEGNLEEAIARVQAIPADTSAGEQSQDIIAQWQEEWAANEQALQEAQQALNAGEWNSAREKASSVTTPYWQARAGDIIQQADEQIAAAEAEQRRLAEAAAAETQAAAFSEAEERCRASDGRNWRENCQDYEQLCEEQGGSFVADAGFIGCTPAIESNKTPKDDKQSEPPPEQNDLPDRNNPPAPPRLIIPGDR
ncbi:MAG: hypothetical protein Kow00121_54630 [Elainellaceae cyanobacterium]